MLLKGPLIVMVVGLAAIALIAVDRSARWLLVLKPLVGIAWLALLVLPWFLAIVGRAGDAFFAESVGQDLLSKVVAGQESHGAPPGNYFVLFWLTFWPGATLGGIGDAGGLGGAARAGDQVPAGLAACHHGSCSNWWSPSCRTTCCRSIPRSRS